MDHAKVRRLVVVVAGVIITIGGTALVLSGVSAWIAAVLGLVLIGWMLFVTA